MEWHEVIEDPSLKDLPYKIETNEWGQIVMTPASGKHALYQGRINFLLQSLGDKGRLASASRRLPGKRRNT